MDTSKHAIAYRPTKAAKVMGISRSQLYNELNAGRIKAHKHGSLTLITARDIDQWLADLPDWQPRHDRSAAKTGRSP